MNLLQCQLEQTKGQVGLLQRLQTEGLNEKFAKNKQFSSLVHVAPHTESGMKYKWCCLTAFAQHFIANTFPQI